MKISIITVCLNAEKTIEKTIKSVVEQDFKDVEYIIVDGKSTDNTLEVVSKYKDRIAKVVSEPDAGLYDAMNKGIQLATGNIIGIINSDDWYEDGIFQQVNQCFEEVDAEVVYGRMNIHNENGYERTLIPTDIQKIYYEMEVPHPTVFMRREVYKMYGGFDLQYSVAADYDYLLRLYVKGIKFHCMDLVLANFCIGGISCQKSIICAKETYAISQKYLQYIPSDKIEYITQIIEERKRKTIFRELLEEKPSELKKKIEVICQKENRNRIAIFGSGKWGKLLKAILEDSIYAPEFLIDNNSDKWNTLEAGTMIVSPEKLKSFNGIVLIAVSDCSKDIYDQMSELNNTEMQCIRWEELV